MKSFFPFTLRGLRLLAGVFCLVLLGSLLQAAEKKPLSLHWEKNYLTIQGDFAGGEVKILYLEAYCRPGSTDRVWGDTVIPHQAELLSASQDGQEIKLRDTLRDGVVVDHLITAGEDTVSFQLKAHNPTDQPSDVDWAQPCMRVEHFTGTDTRQAREALPPYIRKCFLYIDGKQQRLPTTPWATEARYTPGQVYRAPGVPAGDVNPRPLSSLVPSNGLTGCYSADGKQILAVAWEPYQEIFQGVITCLHSDFRIGGLKPGETKQIRGKIYITDANEPKLRQRYENDFPEQAKGASQAAASAQK
ncbi:hypothetical protein [Lignipirellula cremea]|uniref:Uncharacterized protein n=1 Tax=Lignipirellula cremea TaxID=2528010 RepID=A0A518DXY3_9BACT|nr:hypothetical protein [Lignipirellula cremea]QDU96651.1 hypothetical protein Pla8534_44720 [Lignipirellula cremea]